MSTFEKSKKQIMEARKELANGICCECGGIMRGVQGVVDAAIYTCINNGRFVDKYAVKCDRCGKNDFFVVGVKHLGENHES